MKRDPIEVLKEAERIIGLRGQDYGDVEDNFETIAQIFQRATGKDFTPWDVAMLMVCLKLARIRNSPCKKDSYVDAVNYLSFACEIAGAS